jgi:SAM-dependent methyltransferase
MTGTPRVDSERPPTAVFLRRIFHGLRTEGTGVGRETAAIGVGVFIGCLPFYGFHLALCWVVGTLFRLNRLKLYLAANISNPLMAPWLLFTELQLGAWLRRGRFQAITIGAFREAGAVTVGADVLVGSLFLGATLGIGAAIATYFMVRSSPDDRGFIEIVRRASDRYVGTSVTAWEFARGKLRGDPLYRAALFDGLLPAGGTLIDVGCGQGLTLALLAEAAKIWQEGRWLPTDPRPPLFDRMVGVEIRPRPAALAARALGADAEIITGDARSVRVGRARAVLIFDVLHMMPLADQESLLDALVANLEPDGVLLIREADASAGFGFRMVRFGNRAKALAFGNWRQTFHFRTRAEWLALFAKYGLQSAAQAADEGTPFANVLFRLTVAPAASGSRRQAGPPV